MASSLRIAVVCLMATMFIAIGASKQFKVGDAEGWRVPGNDDADMYVKWASKNRFHVGDSVLFEYRNNSVVRVDKRAYYHCNESSRGLAFKDGHTVFIFDKPGFYYFVSADIDHCKEGQRLMIDVMSHPLPPLDPTSPAPSPTRSAASSIPSPRSSAMLAIVALLLLLWRPSELCLVV